VIGSTGKSGIGFRWWWINVLPVDQYGRGTNEVQALGLLISLDLYNLDLGSHVLLSHHLPQALKGSVVGWATFEVQESDVHA
jgi:hypothetical protein